MCARRVIGEADPTREIFGDEVPQPYKSGGDRTFPTLGMKDFVGKAVVRSISLYCETNQHRHCYGMARDDKTCDLRCECECHEKDHR